MPWVERTFGITLAFRWTGAALASAIMGFPLLVRAIRLAFDAIDPKLEQAAATLGANRAWTFATVSLPLALPGIVAGLVLAFAKALGAGICASFARRAAAGREPGRRDLRRSDRRTDA